MRTPAGCRSSIRLGLLGAVLVAAAGCGGSSPLVSLQVTPAAGQLDAPLQVALSGLPHDRTVTVSARATDAYGVVWTSTARFASGRDGRVDLSHPSLGGSWTGVQPGGLATLFTPASDGRDQLVFASPPDGYAVQVQATDGSEVLASATVHRSTPQGAGAVQQRHLRPATDGVYGEAYSPTRPAPGLHPAVLVFGGSEGGESMNATAALLAAHGYPAVSLAYFRETGLPATLDDIPLEYFERALTLLRALPGVDPAHVVVSGTSRGSEAALLLGAHAPQLVDAVVAGAPSSVVNAGYPDGTRSAWTLGGVPLTAVSRAQYGNPTPAGEDAAVIPVEDLHGPLLMTCGTEDTVWPSCGYAAAIRTRLDQHGSRVPVTLVTYAGAGHEAGFLDAVPGVSPAEREGLGGTPAADAAADRGSYTQLLAFVGRQAG